MRVVDLTHVIKEDMPVYPGTETPKFLPGSTYDADGFKETCLQMFTHRERIWTRRRTCSPTA